MARDQLGEFEHQVLLTLLRLGDGVYSLPIVLELEARTGRDVGVAGVYIVLRRLEEKGLVRSEMQAPEDGVGGRDRRVFLLTDEGLRRLQETRWTLQRLWEGMEPLLERGG